MNYTSITTSSINHAISYNTIQNKIAKKTEYKNTEEIYNHEIEVNQPEELRKYKSFYIENNNLHPELKDKLENLWKNCKTIAEKDSFADMYATTFSSSVSDIDKWSSDWRSSLKETIEYRRGFFNSVPPESRLLMQEHEKWFNKLLS